MYSYVHESYVPPIAGKTGHADPEMGLVAKQMVLSTFLIHQKVYMVILLRDCKTL